VGKVDSLICGRVKKFHEFSKKSLYQFFKEAVVIDIHLVRLRFSLFYLRVNIDSKEFFNEMG
jgi:hypothetical protein